MFSKCNKLTLEVTTPNIKFERIVGSGKEGIEEIIEKNGLEFGKT